MLVFKFRETLNRYQTVFYGMIAMFSLGNHTCRAVYPGLLFRQRKSGGVKILLRFIFPYKILLCFRAQTYRNYGLICGELLLLILPYFQEIVHKRHQTVFFLEVSTEIMEANRFRFINNFQDII